MRLRRRRSTGPMTRRRHLVLVAAPLPECALCDAPTRRDVWEALGGVCTDCDATAKALAARVAQLSLGDPE